MCIRIYWKDIHLMPYDYEFLMGFGVVCDAFLRIRTAVLTDAQRTTFL